MYIRQLGPCHPVPDSRRPLVSPCHPIPTTPLLPPPSLPSPHHSYSSFHVIKSIRLFTNHTLPGSSAIKCATPSICPICTTTTFLLSSRHSTRIIPSSPPGFLYPRTPSTVTIATSWTLSTWSRTLKSPSSLPTILPASVPLGASVRSLRRTHTQSALV